MNIGDVYRVNEIDYVVIGGNETTKTATVVSMDKINDAEKHFRPMDTSALTERIGEIEIILKTRKAAAGKLWNSNGCTDKVVAFGTEDKSVQFKVNIANLFDTIKCIENDDRSFEMCYTDNKKAIIIKTDHGIGLVMPVQVMAGTKYENDYILKTQK